MLYYVQYGDNLFNIAARFGTTVDAILKANVICNPGIIFPAQPLIVPVDSERGEELPKAGGFPYYAVQPGDYLNSIAQQFKISLKTLARNNGIVNSGMINPGTELLVLPIVPNAEKLKASWLMTAKRYCNTMSPLMEHGVFYMGTYEWQALGTQALPHLLEMLKNSCPAVRLHAVISLARIGAGGSMKPALQEMLKDKPEISSMARLALRRIELVGQGKGRIHLLSNDSRLLSEPSLKAAGVGLPVGAEIVVLRWNIPSPSAEEGPGGEVQIYDLVRVVKTGKAGYIARIGYNEAPMV